MEFLCILNVDDYHDIHEARQPATTSLHHISHMATIIVNTSPIFAIKQFINKNIHIHNPLIINTTALCDYFNLPVHVTFWFWLYRSTPILV